MADRETVELESDGILAGADESDVALLVVGDPLGCVGSYLNTQRLDHGQYRRLPVVQRLMPISFCEPMRRTSQRKSFTMHPL